MHHLLNGSQHQSIRVLSATMVHAKWKILLTITVSAALMISNDKQRY
jgi:hypothetical protein